jgi:hypothetical protein
LGGVTLLVKKLGNRHIVPGFFELNKIYLKNRTQPVQLIITNNLFGFEIDDDITIGWNGDDKAKLS